ncbi:hydrolase glyoxylase [Brevibacillus choshinensis]|uniref:Hydrolase glyoxylase n=1 Tax=Brevibacillus choshinensis TaxID=54911 RepID=A0ABR5NDD6_BRECH|nr:MBL fold metallo-hydrolase [Brevibacillus choshinensis]KQL49579.1 hydrolase glyoxylase [Brevibacillus choshinensis]
MNVRLTLFDTGFCRQWEMFSIKGGRLRNIAFHAIAGLIEHPVHGLFLFDTGYSPRFFEATRSLPYALYAKITPVVTRPEQSVKAQLEERGIQVEHIKGIFLSHFHADHIGGLRDFPDSHLYCLSSAYEHVRGKFGLRALREGFLPDLMPHDFAERTTFIDRSMPIPLSKAHEPFTEAYDYFGDGSILLVELNGHATGQMGLFLRDQDQGDVFLCADAAWSSEAYRNNLLPHPIAQLIMADGTSYKENLTRLHQLSAHWPSLKILPTHCPEVWQMTQGAFAWRL